MKKYQHSAGAPSSRDVVVELGKKPSALQLYQRMIREWGRHLDPCELAVAMQIADRTVGWQKSSAPFSATRITEGDTRWAGLQIGRTKLFECLATLERMGIIARRDHPKGKEIKVYSFNVGWSPALYDASGGVKAQFATRTTPSVRRTTPVRHADTIERNRGERILKKEDYSVSAPPRPVPEVISDIRATMAGATAASRARRDDKTKSLPDKVAGAEAAWHSAMAEAFPQAIQSVWTVRERARVKAKIKTWIAKEGSLPEFIGWCVGNWTGVITKQLRWMTKSPPPKVPEIGFLLAFIGQFIECRSEGKLDEWLTSPERTEMELLTGRGMSPDQAAAEVGRRRAVEGMRDENEKVRIEARARHRRAEIVEKRTLAIVDLPPHPDSAIARAARKAAVPTPVKHTDDELASIDWATVPVLDPNWEPPL